MIDFLALRDFVWIDVESTGVDVARDRIIEFCLLDGVPAKPWVQRVNPGIPIPREATAVHGITDADVADCPPFSLFARAIQRMIEGKILAGYSSRKLDVPMLDAELRRAGQPGFPRHPDGRLDVREVDLYQIWQRCEPRTLVGAAKRFAGVELGDAAHGAEADTTVLPAVLEGMLAAFKLAGHDVEAICALSVPEGEVDRDGKFRRREDGVVVFNFGQKRGTPVLDEEGLLSWMLPRDFSAETKTHVRAFLEVIDARRELEQEQRQLEWEAERAHAAPVDPVPAGGQLGFLDGVDDLPF